MHPTIHVISLLIVFLSSPTYAFDWHCSSADATISLDVSNTRTGNLSGTLLAEHPAIGHASVALLCGSQGSDSATLLRCSPAGLNQLPLTAYIFRGNRPEWPHLFARVYLSGEVLADLMSCQMN